MIMSLAERSRGRTGRIGRHITAIFSVLVAGSDMEEPVADILRGVLDGHVVMTVPSPSGGAFRLWTCCVGLAVVAAGRQHARGMR